MKIKYSSNAKETKIDIDIDNLDLEMFEDEAIFMPKEVKRICKTCGNYFKGNCTFKHIQVKAIDTCLQYK